MSGYSAPYIGLPDPEKKAVMNMGTFTEQPTLAERRDKSWYKKLSLSIRIHGKSGHSSFISARKRSPTTSQQEYLNNKPLPALPSPQLPPYFEYMFADAGIKGKKSNETMKSNSEADSNTQETASSEFVQARAPTSNISAQSYGLNSAEIAQFAFAHAGVTFSTKDYIDNHFAALGTGLEGHLDLDKLAEDLEKEKATEAFFGGVQAKEAPSANHVPVVDEDGFVDRRDGLEDWPQLWAPDKETLANYVVPGLENFSTQHDNNGQKHILQPKSRKTRVRLQDPPFPDSSAAAATSTAPAVQPVRSPVRPPRPLTIRKKTRDHGRQGSQAHRVNKRSARDSFVTKSTVTSPKPDDYNINLLTTKKIRVTETLVDEDINSPSRAVSHCGSITSPSSVDLTDSTSNTELTDAPSLNDDDSDTSLLSLKRRRLTGSLTGYPGQFESYKLDYLRTRATNDESSEFTSGDTSHPHGLFTHKNFVPDPTFPSKDYTKAMLNALPVRELALTHAENMTLTYSCSHNVCALRTPTQEMLRREIHRECASARLEGVSVGEYRYYQGFMSLEEYIGARVCVCWGYCWCSKLCSIYGDVLCPCSEWVEVHGDDD